MMRDLMEYLAVAFGSAFGIVFGVGIAVIALVFIGRIVL